MDLFLISKIFIKSNKTLYVLLILKYYSSSEWNRISTGEKEKLGLTFEEDGEFWYENYYKTSTFTTTNYFVFDFFRMQFEDFVAEFTDLSICHLINTSFFSWRKTWRETLMKVIPLLS